MKISLQRLAEGMHGLTSASGSVMAECAGVCLEINELPSGCAFAIDGEHEATATCDWSAVTEQQRLCYADLQEATERGAYGIAILVAEGLTGQTVISRSAKGPGFDYWIGVRETDDANFFSTLTRLEVSGILKGSRSQVLARAQRKELQIKPSAHLAPALVIIVEFSSPYVRVNSYD